MSLRLGDELGREHHQEHVSKERNRVDTVGQRADVLKKSVRHLRQGGAILTFPAGQIEPDPFVREGALASVHSWSDSLDLFARLVPELNIMVVMVAGVFNPMVLRHPLVKLRSTVEAKELFAAALQLAWRVLFATGWTHQACLSYQKAFFDRRYLFARLGSTDPVSCIRRNATET